MTIEKTKHTACCFSNWYHISWLCSIVSK